jgi:FPC/CPF motif-containing protein YcgG
VSADPNDPHFSLSFGGEAFFVVGLHPRASRPARRFERPAPIFNLRDQFEQQRSTASMTACARRSLRAT